MKGSLCRRSPFLMRQVVGLLPPSVCWTAGVQEKRGKHRDDGWGGLRRKTSEYVVLLMLANISDIPVFPKSGNFLSKLGLRKSTHKITA